MATSKNCFVHISGFCLQHCYSSFRFKQLQNHGGLHIIYYWNTYYVCDTE